MDKRNKGDGFNNRAAKKFRQDNLNKIDTISQDEIYEILGEDVLTIFDQFTAYREHRGKWPSYVANAFANLSTALFFYEYAEEHITVKKNKIKKTDLTEDQLLSFQHMIADVYKKSASNTYAMQSQEFGKRNKLLSKTFAILNPKMVKKAKRFDPDKVALTKSNVRDLAIQVYGDPVRNMRFIYHLVDRSPLSDKKKIKLLRDMYGKKRFPTAVGAAFTVDTTKSDLIASLFEYVSKLPTKKRAPFIRAYADAYKENKVRNRLHINSDFIEQNRKLIKELKWIDIGYEKAFASTSGKKEGQSDKKRREKEKAKLPFAI